MIDVLREGRVFYYSFCKLLGLNPALFQPLGRAAGSHVHGWEIRNDREPSAGDVSSTGGEAQVVARQWVGNPQ